MQLNQKTIQNEITLKGIGLHTGKEVTMTFKPAGTNQGYAFVRVDLEGKPTIEPRAEYVVDTQRGTNLEKNGVSIHTSEHVLAAAVGLGITNLIIEIDAAEPPIMDGSSKYFVEALEKAIVVEQGEPVENTIVKEVISLKEEATGSEIMSCLQMNTKLQLW